MLLRQMFEQYYKIYYLDDDQNVYEDIQYRFNEKFKIYLREQNRGQLVEYYEKFYDEDNIDEKELDCILKLMKNQEIKLNQSQIFNLDQRLKLLYCKTYNINKYNNINNEFQDNEQKETIAMWLTSFQKLVPRQWMHSYEIKNKDNKTLKDLMIDNYMLIPQEQQDDDKMSIFDQAYFGIIPNITGHKPEEQNEQGYTVAMILADNNIDIPKQWYHNPQIQNNRGNTVALLQAFRGKIPNKQWQHDSSLQTKGGNTVAMCLAYHGIIPPKQWEHDPNLQNDDGWTVAMYIAYYCKQIPLKYWNHNSNIQSKNYNLTVSMLLAINNINPPQQWYHNPNLQCIDGWTTAMYIAYFCKQIPDECWNHNPNIQNVDGNTVSILLASRGIIPPQQWYHDSNLQNKTTKSTVAMFLVENGIIPPEQWHHKPELQNKYSQTTAMNIIGFCKQIPEQYWYHDPIIQDIQGRTVAMYFVIFLKQIPPKQWEHNPNIQNKYNSTVAMLLAENGIVPPEQWRHSPQLKDKENHTVEDYLVSNNLYVPEQWQTNSNKIPSDEDKKIIEEYCNQYKIKANYNISPIYNINGDKNTVAMYLSSQKRDIPKIWRHDVTIKNTCGQTVAMIYAKNGIISPHEWEHDPTLYDNDYQTVAIYLLQNRITPPIQWCYDLQLQFGNLEKLQNYFYLFNITPPEYAINMSSNKDDIIQFFKDKEFSFSSDYQESDSSTFDITQKYFDTILDQLYNTPVDEYQNNLAMIDAKNKIIPRFCNYKPEEQNEDGWTVAMLLANENIMPPRKWMHDYNMKNKYGHTLKYYLEKHDLPVPYHWKNEQQMTIFDQACFGIIPDITGHKSDEQNEDGFTIAMILTLINISIPQCWYHKADIQNNEGYTVAMYQAIKKKIPDKQWYHDSIIQNKMGYTVALYLINNKIFPPKEWCYDPDKKVGCFSLKESIYNEDLIPSRFIINMSQNKKEFIQYFENHYGKIPIPSEQQETNPTIFDQAMLRQIPELGGHKPEEQDEDGWTVAMILAYQGIQPPRQWMHNYNIENKYGITLIGYLETQFLLIPQHWNDDNMDIFDQAIFGLSPQLGNHKTDERNKQGFTVAMIQALQGKIPDKEWIHDRYLRCNYQSEYYTVQNLLQQKDIAVPIEWQYKIVDTKENNQITMITNSGLAPPYLSDVNPKYQNKYGGTVATQLAIIGLMLPKKQMNNYDIKNISNNILKYCLENHNLPTSYHQHDDGMNQFDKACFGEILNILGYKSDEQNEDGQTIAMILAMLKKEIPQQWYHNKFIRNKYGQTVQNIYQMNNQQVPQYWQYTFKDEDENTEAMIQAAQGIIPDQQYFNDPLQSNKYGNTVAILLSQNGIIPPRKWMHDLNIKNIRGKTIKSNLEEQQLPIPYHWNGNIDIFDQACFRIIPNIQGHKPDEQDEYGFTIAMILAAVNKEIPEQWEHDPNIRNKYGYTVAMYQARNGIIPQHQWYHNKFLRVKYENKLYSVHSFLMQNNTLNVPKHWWYEIANQQEDNKALQQAINNQTPNLQQDYPTNYQNINGQTVAMILASKGFTIPEQWKHDPNLQDVKRNTVAMYYIKAFQNLNKNMIIAIKQNYGQIQQYLNLIFQWYHNPSLQEEHGYTVAMMLADLGIDDIRWYHDPLIKSKYGNTVALKLLKQKIFPPQYWLHDFNIKNYKRKSIKSLLIKYNILTKVKQSVECQCGHQSNIFLNYHGYKICLQCLQNRCMNKNQQTCPICYEDLYTHIKVRLNELTQQNIQNESSESSYSNDESNSEYNDRQSLNSSYLSRQQRSEFGIDGENDNSSSFSNNIEDDRANDFDEY